jgi:hypothetical protein
MKKIILLIILSLNLSINFNGSEIRVTTTSAVYAQNNGERCPGEKTFWERLGSALKGVADFFAGVYESVKDFFTKDDDGSNNDDEGMGEEEDEQTEMQEKYDYNDDGFNYDPFGDNGQNPWDEPNFNNDNWSQDDWYIIENLAGAIHYFDQQDRNFPIILDSSLRIRNKLEPTRDSCIEIDAKNASDKITALYNRMDTLKGFQRVKDSALYSKNEVGVSILENGTDIDTFYFNVGEQFGTSTATSSHVIATAHTHTISTSISAIDYTATPINSPSLPDISSLIKADSNFNVIQASFILTGDGTKLALSIEDSLKAINFRHFLILNNAIDPNTNNWSKNLYPPNNFTFYDIYTKIRKALIKLGYQYKYLDLYANVIMLNNVFNAGVRISILIDGKFKEIRADGIFDIERNILKVNGINICK